MLLLFVSWQTIIKNFFAKHTKLENFITHKLRQIADTRSIKNYENMSKKELLSATDESRKRLDLVAEMQNVSQSEQK